VSSVAQTRLTVDSRFAATGTEVSYLRHGLIAHAFLSFINFSRAMYPGYVISKRVALKERKIEFGHDFHRL
jgi:hypothetical protein